MTIKDFEIGMKIFNCLKETEDEEINYLQYRLYSELLNFLMTSEIEIGGIDGRFREYVITLVENDMKEWIDE